MCRHNDVLVSLALPRLRLGISDLHLDDARQDLPLSRGHFYSSFLKQIQHYYYTIVSISLDKGFH